MKWPDKALHRTAVALRSIAASELGFYIDPETREPHIQCLRSGAEGQARTAAPQEKRMKQNRFPAGWDEARVRRALTRYESQSDDETLAEDEAAYEDTTDTVMDIPVELVPAGRDLLAKHGKDA